MTPIEVTPARAERLISELGGGADRFSKAMVGMWWPLPPGFRPPSRALSAAPRRRGETGRGEGLGDLSSNEHLRLDGLHIEVYSSNLDYAGRRFRILLDDIPISGTEQCPDGVLTRHVSEDPDEGAQVAGEVVITLRDVRSALAKTDVEPTEWRLRPQAIA